MTAIEISPDQNTFTHAGKKYHFVPSPTQVGAYDCDACALVNSDLCEQAPCDIQREDNKKGYFKLLK